MHRHLRIAIDGAQSTGKTTLLGQLALNYGERFGYIGESARVIAPQFGVLGEADWPDLLADLDRLNAFFDAEDCWVEAEQARHPSFVIDSSRFLIAAYRAVFLGTTPKDLTFEYDVILYCGLGPNSPASNGFRFLQERSAVDSKYRTIIDRAHSGAVAYLPGGAVRLKSAIHSIDQLLLR